jgi:hypothetical protein
MIQITELSDSGVKSTEEKVKENTLLLVEPRNGRAFLAYYRGTMKDIIFLERVTNGTVEKLSLTKDIRSMSIMEITDIVKELLLTQKENTKFVEVMDKTASDFNYILEFSRQQKLAAIGG